MAASDLVVAFTGASGSPYGVRLVEVLLRAGQNVHLTISPAAAEVIEAELGVTMRLGAEEFDARPLFTARADGLDFSRLHYHHYRDFRAGIASGSFLTGGMVVCPCSMGTLAAIAQGTNLPVVPRESLRGIVERDTISLLGLA